MRRFSPDYLADTRRGMWQDSRRALDGLSLHDRGAVLDVGCGTGALTRVLREESPVESRVVGCDADPALLHEGYGGEVVAGDATRLPFADATFDLVVCQALLVNLPDPRRAVAEFARVSADLVATIEPDNAAVSVESTVGGESALAESAREAYVAGTPTDVTLGDDARHLLRDAGLSGIETDVYYLTRITEPPYSAADMEAARRKIRATRIEDARETLLAGGLSEATVDALAEDWRAMGRATLDQMHSEAYRRAEVVPFYVTVGRV